MFAGGLEPELHRSLTVQLASTGSDLSIHPTPGSKNIHYFLLLMDGSMEHIFVNKYHAPARAAELIAYQCISTSASIQYPTAAWLSYDVQFCTLAASDPYVTLGCMTH